MGVLKQISNYFCLTKFDSDKFVTFSFSRLVVRHHQFFESINVRTNYAWYKNICADLLPHIYINMTIFSNKIWSPTMINYTVESYQNINYHNDVLNPTMRYRHNACQLKINYLKFEINNLRQTGQVQNFCSTSQRNYSPALLTQYYKYLKI